MLEARRRLNHSRLSARTITIALKLLGRYVLPMTATEPKQAASLWERLVSRSWPKPTMEALHWRSCYEPQSVIVVYRSLKVKGQPETGDPRAIRKGIGILVRILAPHRPHLRLVGDR